MTNDVEELYAELYAAAGLGRRVGEQIAGLDGQTLARWQTMWTIDAGSELTVPQIARRLGVSRQNQQRVVNDLIAQRLAEFLPNPDHKTSPLVRLTSEGERVLESINQTATESNDSLLAELSATKVAQLRTLLQDFTDALRNHHTDV